VEHYIEEKTEKGKILQFYEDSKSREQVFLIIGKGIGSYKKSTKEGYKLEKYESKQLNIFFF